ncbi:Peptidase C48, SUMO/Sentrin/Ubl1, partial [Cynara cardunculus var. scolymus]
FLSLSSRPKDGGCSTPLNHIRNSQSALVVSLNTPPFQSIPLLQTLSTPTSPTILCMEIEQENACNGVKRNEPLTLDWEQLLPTASADDDRPPELVVKSEKKSKDGSSGGDAEQDQKEHFELLSKSDHEINEYIARHKTVMQTLSSKLPDKGEKLKATFRRHVEELERRKKLQSEKGHNGCEETIQLSDHSDDGASCGKKKGDQKSLSTSTFAKLFCNRLEKDKDSRTVNAFEDDLSFINPCQGKKVKPNSQLLGKRRSRMGLSSRPASTQESLRSPRTPSVDSEKLIISNDDKKENNSATSSPDHLAGNKSCSFSETNFYQDQPSRNLRPRHRRTYHLVDEEPLIQTTIQYGEKLDDSMKDVTVYYPSRDDPGSVEVNYADMACLAPEACLSSAIMNFYIRYLQQPTSSSESATCNSHFFNTYFYNKLEKLSYKEDSFLKFRKWWKGVSIFEKAYILLPIHENAHWSLVIICIPTKEDELGPMLLHLDSLGLHDSRSLFDNIRRFLKEEWSFLRKSEEPLDLPITEEIWENLDRRIYDRRVTVPQQRNEYDCGLFVLFYMERFIKEAPDRLRKKDLSMFGKQWFHPEEASNLRVRIHNLLVQEFKSAKEKEKASSPKC